MAFWALQIMADLSKYYEILGLEPGALLEEVKQAYRDMAKVWHPDRFLHDERLQKKAVEKIKEINKAYNILQEYLSKPRIIVTESNVPPRKPPTKQYASSTKTEHEPQITKTIFSASLGLLRGVIIFLGIIYILMVIFFVIMSLIPESRQVERPLEGKSLLQKAPSESIGKSLLEPYELPIKREQIGVKQFTSYFSIGSTKDEVVALQGPPVRIDILLTKETWYYGLSTVDFIENRVVGWSNAEENLKVVNSP